MKCIAQHNNWTIGMVAYIVRVLGTNRDAPRIKHKYYYLRRPWYFFSTHARLSLYML